jgi:predicted acylesterase/phospholipase RssA
MSDQRTALVLGGGGITGIAWEIGVVAGLAEAGVDLGTAVGAGCAVPGVYPPVTIADRRYVDGGLRSPADVDLADGYDRIVVLAPLPRGMGAMAGVDAQVTTPVSRVAVVSPDVASRKAIGRNVLGPLPARPRLGPAGRRPPRSSPRSPRSGPADRPPGAHGAATRPGRAPGGRRAMIAAAQSANEGAGRWRIRCWSRCPTGSVCSR